MSTVVGNPIRLTASFADATGTLVDPTAVTVHLTLPDGTISTPAATRDSTGVYHYDYTTVQTGIHQYYFAGTGSNAAAQTPDIFTVSDGTTAALVSLYDVKAHLNKTQTVTTDDAELNRFIHGATAIVNHLCGWTVPTTFTETVTPSWGAGTDALGPYGSGYVPISVSKIPVMSVTAIQPKFYNVAAASLTNIVIDSNAGIIYLPTNNLFLGPCDVTYRAGRTTVPTVLVDACLMIVKSLWESQRPPDSGRSSGWGQRSGVAEEELVMLPSGEVIPQRALELLQRSPYFAAPGFA